MLTPERLSQTTKEMEQMRARKVREYAGAVLEKGMYHTDSMTVIEINGAIVAVNRRGFTGPADETREWQELITISPDDTIKVGYITDLQGKFPEYLEMEPFSMDNEDAVRTLAVKLANASNYSLL